jgi:hypothetical protein
MDHTDIFPIVEENFLTPQAIRLLINWVKQREDSFNKHINEIEYWNGKCIYYRDMPSDIQRVLKSASLAMRKYIQINLINESRYLYSELPQLIRWKEGDVMTPHADNIEQDGMTPNTSPWRDFGGVIYLNSDFEGGKIYYPNLGIEVTPRPGMLVLHPGELKYTHGVSRINTGKRYTIVSFFTFDQSYAGFSSED